MDTISHLSVTSNIPPSRKPGRISNDVDIEDTAVLKERVTKYTKKTSSLANNKELTASCSKGKHKVTLSLDGIAGGKADRSDKKCK